MSFHNEPSSVLGSSSLAYTTSNNEAVLSKNGAYLLQVVSDGLKIHNLENGSEVSVALSGVRPGGNLAPVAISNDGSIVFVRTWNGLLVDSGSGGLFKVSLDGSHQRLDVDQSGNTFSYQGWSIEGSDVDITPDGSKIVFAIRDTLDHKTWTAQQTNVYVKDLSTGSLIQVDLPSTNGVSVSSSNPRISSDGQRVLFETNLNLDGQFFGTNSSPSISPQTSVYAVSVTSGGVYEKVNKDGANQISSAYGWHAEMSADGSAVVFQTSEQLSADDINSVSDVYFKNLTNGQIRLVSDGSSKGGIYPWISPDGAFVAYKPYSYQVENQGLIWSVVSSKTQVIPGTTELSIGSFPNDSIYALSDNRVLLWSWNQYLADEVDPNANYYLYNYKIPSATVVNDTSKSVATYSLSNNSYSVNEGSTASFTLTTKNLASGTSVPYTLSGVSEADVSGGLSGTAVVNSNGVATITVTLLNDNLTEGAETLTVTAGGASASSVVNDTSKSVATYSLSNNSYSVNEGSAASFTLTTKNLASGTSVPYTLSGVTAADVSGGLSGTAVVNSSGVATISAILLNDKLTEGAETLTVTAGGASASTVVNDTSKGATYAISSTYASIDEGSIARFTITPSNLTSGTYLPYTLSGISSDDVIGSLSGSVYVYQYGGATISATLRKDNLSEGTETLTVTAGGASASTVVNDTSINPTYEISSTYASIDEGNIARFKITASNLESSTYLPYTLSGISSDDVSGSLSGSVYVSQYSGATISATLLNDNSTEGAETLTVTAGGASASTVVNDTSKSPTYSLSSASSSVNEGGTAVFTLTSKNVSGYTQIPYTLSGISAADLSFGSLTGSTYAYSSGVQTINVYLRSDRATEGPETLTITVGDTSASVIINDTSDGGPVYELAASGSSVNEGSTAVFTLTTKKVDAGTAVAYTISGVKAADVIGGKLFGTAVVNASGTATISVALANDTLSEGVETMMVTAQGASASLIVNDTSKGIPTYKLSTANSTVNEGGTASFNLSTTNVLPGSSVSWTLEGLSADDVAGGRTSGSAVISVAGSATIDIPVVADQKTEGAEAFTLRVGNTQAVGTVKDTSISSTDKKTIVTDVPSLVNVRGGKVFLSSTNPEEIVGTNKFDTVSSNLASHKARITKTSLGWSIQNNDDTQDTDTLVAVERVDFSNGQSHAFDVGTNGNAGKTAKMLTVLFGPQALNNPQYVGIGIATLDDGQTYQELITTALSVSGLASSDQLVSALYRNLTGYEGTAFQKKLYIDMLDSGAITSERLIELAGDAAMQIQTNLINLADTGLAYKQSLPLPKPVSYELSSSAPSIDEGGIISISLLTKNLSAGTSVAYTVSGISADDLANASLSGNFVVDGSGLGQIALSVRADQQTEGPETLTLTAGTASIAVSINDVSLVGVSGGEGGGFGDGAGFGGGGGGD